MTAGGVTDAYVEYVAALRARDMTAATLAAGIVDAEDAARNDRRTVPGNVALWYAARGVPVFPCSPATKRPLTRHGFKDATVDADRIVEWWGRWPDAMIGAPTGHRFDVIDVDGPKGVRSWLERWDDMPPLIGHALTARAEGGGHHLYVTPVEGRGNKAGMAPGIDYRGAGGYVIVPPSVAANGRRYRWLQPLNFG